MSFENIKEKANLRYSIAIGVILWILAMIIAMLYMAALGVDLQDETVEWGINHEQYWVFEALIIPTFLIIGIAFFYWIFKKSTIDPSEWLIEGIVTGLVVMIIQFILDLIVIVFLFQNTLDYFIGMVTISYLFIIVQSTITNWFVKIKLAE
jgi:hypothetical protein